MVKWIGVSLISELNEWIDTRLEWLFPHPSITTDDPHFLLKWQLTWNGVTTPSAAYRPVLTWEYHEAGTTWGTYNMGNLAWANFLDNGGTFSFVAGTWSVITPAQFTNAGSTTFQKLRRATWAENPDFHPYRTRP